MKSFVMLILMFSCSMLFAHPPLKTVDYVDLDRYQGDWYEIARFEHSFQRGCTATKANYKKKANGEIRVINECRKNHPEGRLKRAIGRAWIKDRDSNAKLKVQFFLRWFRIGFLSGDYWVIDLDEDDYSYAVIGEPSRKYLWILAREKTLPKEIYEDLVTRAQNQGFDISKLKKTVHKK